MKAIIIDDDSQSIRLTKGLLKRFFPEIAIIGEGQSVDDAVNLINSLTPDLVLMDIHLINGTGFDVLDQLDYNPLVVFITGYDTYMLSAIKAEACDYVLKPIVEEEFIEAIIKCRRRYNVTANYSTSNFHAPSFIAIKGKTDVFLPIDDVIYFESWGSYTYCYYNDEKMVISLHLGEMEKRLPKHKFFRTHRRFLINIDKVSHFRINNRVGYVTLNNKKEIDVSARKISEFKKMLNIL